MASVRRFGGAYVPRVTGGHAGVRPPVRGTGRPGQGTAVDSCAQRRGDPACCIRKGIPQPSGGLVSPPHPPTEGVPSPGHPLGADGWTQRPPPQWQGQAWLPALSCPAKMCVSEDDTGRDSPGAATSIVRRWAAAPSTSGSRRTLWMAAAARSRAAADHPNGAIVRRRTVIA
eukprot:scaffold1172_cov124-Isochrysis_galbana.AAC.4